MAEGVNYIAVKPPLVVNYADSGKMKYIKADFSVRAENAHDALEITHHLPLVRDRLISILSAQSEDIITTPKGKELLRLKALAEINQAIHAVEAGENFITPESNNTHAKPEHTSKPNDEAKTAHGEKPNAEHSSEHTGPATDLLFNNFVVQK
jgi:hypothetical protein